MFACITLFCGPRRRLAASLLAAAACLLIAAPLSAQSTDFEDWHGFAKGSWCEIRTTSETLDERGEVVSTTVSTVKFTLERAAGDAVTLEVAEGTVEYAGKSFRTPAARLILRPFGRGENEKLQTEDLSADGATKDGATADGATARGGKADGEKKAGRRIKALITGEAGSREVTSVFRSASLRRPVRRTVKTFDAKGEPVATATTDLFVEEVPYPVGRGFRPTAYYRSYYRNHKLSSTAVIAKSDEIPGQLVSAATIERDASGRIFRRTRQELVDYHAIEAPPAVADSADGVASEAVQGLTYGSRGKERRIERREQRREERRARQ